MRNYVADLKRDFDDPRSPVVATEFCGTSITSRGAAQERIDAALPLQPAHPLRPRATSAATCASRSTRNALQAQLSVVDDAADPSSAVRTAARSSSAGTRAQPA